MHDPCEPHLTTVKCIFRCLQVTLYDDLLRRAPTFELVIYTDVDWVGCLNNRQSTLGYTVFLGENLVPWSSKRQNVVSCWSAKAE
jgi:hypothetical protein